MKFKIGIIVVAFTLFLFICSSLRHIFFHSTAYDLGIFDQAVYLISQGQIPISSILNFHILGDHAAFIWYPISLFYKIYPSVYWLFAIQASALSLGAYFVYKISLQEGINVRKSLLIALVYIFYPTIISANFFDFHPDTIALPSYFWLILIARQSNQSNNRISLIKFSIGILIILSCKAVFSLTVAIMGIWLIIFEKKKTYGAIAITSGISWFIIATQVVIPYFGTNDASISRHITHYGYLGTSFSEIIINIFSKPQILIAHIFSLPILIYLTTLFLPIIWGLSLKHLSPIICGFPQILMSTMSSNKSLYTIGYHYTLSIVPFLFIALIANFKFQNYWIKDRRLIIFLIVIGSLISFRPHIDIGSNIGRDFSSLTNSLQASKNAVQKIFELDNLNKDEPKGSVITTAKIIPHLSHRSMIKLADENSLNEAIGVFDFILLNVRYPILTSTKEFAQNLSERLKTDNRYKLVLHENEVFLFVKKV
jgi:uncharacterized membrane protein